MSHFKMDSVKLLFGGEGLHFLRVYARAHTHAGERASLSENKQERLSHTFIEMHSCRTIFSFENVVLYEICDIYAA